jgi:hypothetical protein
MHTPLPQRVKTSRQNMSALLPKIAPPEQRHEHTTTVHGRRPMTLGNMRANGVRSLDVL